MVSLKSGIGGWWTLVEGQNNYAVANNFIKLTV